MLFAILTFRRLSTLDTARLDARMPLTMGPSLPLSITIHRLAVMSAAEWRGETIVAKVAET